ncbi:hypothetical protein M407DRAFT_23127 [Tulasnella calospora MUT 4182]|uniref:Uncharacterized protein n=1 Tax=Tulasnella calospora MUT 4182 TaxID=1051891 RepID=A0A0C3QLN8_9AGAM|nr:hypothetical protein M407DRAFT_23127 [Tulasnella calospora MUT 4182]
MSQMNVIVALYRALGTPEDQMDHLMNAQPYPPHDSYELPIDAGQTRALSEISNHSPCIADTVVHTPTISTTHVRIASAALHSADIIALASIRITSTLHRPQAHAVRRTLSSSSPLNCISGPFPRTQATELPAFGPILSQPDVGTPICLTSLPNISKYRAASLCFIFLRRPEYDGRIAYADCPHWNATCSWSIPEKERVSYYRVRELGRFAEAVIRGPFRWTLGICVAFNQSATATSKTTQRPAEGLGSAPGPEAGGSLFRASKPMDAEQSRRMMKKRSFGQAVRSPEAAKVSNPFERGNVGDMSLSELQPRESVTAGEDRGDEDSSDDDASRRCQRFAGRAAQGRRMEEQRRNAQVDRGPSSPNEAQDTVRQGSSARTSPPRSSTSTLKMSP